MYGHPLPPHTAPTDDLSAIAWVQPELRRTLEAAHKSLRRYLRHADAIGDSDLDSADPAPLVAARHQLHMGAGALAMLSMPALAQVLHASETAVQRMVARPALLNAAALTVIERNSFALLDYLARQLAGKPVSPVMLFPQYSATQQLAGADRVHPADLWPVPWQWRELPVDRSAQPRAADDAARAEMESSVLALMRQPDGSLLARLSDFCADLAAGAAQSAVADGRLATLWQMASALFEAQAGGLLKNDIHVKRLASRLLVQLRMNVRGQHDLSDRLAQDLLFFCHHAAAPNDAHPAPRLAAVRATWPQPAGLAAGDYDTPSLGRFDPALLALARKRLAAAKDTWSAVAGGELHRLATLGEVFSLVDESVRRIFPEGSRLGHALLSAAERTAAAQTEPAPTLAMEVATALLYLDACLEDGEFDHPELATRMQHLGQRIHEVAEGADPQPLEAWMEELYRRVSDRQTMGSVVQELRASLSDVEKHIDLFFRQPAERQGLVPVPQQLSAMRGVLSVLGMAQASQAVLRMRDDVQALIKDDAAVPQAEMERLADNLGALSFLIDMLSVQPQLAKQLFQFDAATGSLHAVMGQTHRPAAPPAAAPASAGGAPLVDQVQALALALTHPAALAPDDEDLTQRLDRLAQQALAADETELARTLSGARVALHSAGDAATRQALRSDLAQGLLGLGPVLEPAPLPPGPVPPPRPPSAPGRTGLEDDLEMREIFIEEAREVVADARDALHRLAEHPETAGDMTQLRRAFHTLKGSSRMVGLTDFGQAAWACEQLFNARLAEQNVRMDAPLRAFTEQALSTLGHWTDAIEAGDAQACTPESLVAAADALRNSEGPVDMAWVLPDTQGPVLAPAPAVAQPQADRADFEGFDGFDAFETFETFETFEIQPAQPFHLPSGADADADADSHADADEAAEPASATATATSAAPAPIDLAQRVPGLPSAADLDLGALAVRPDRVPFEFDLDHLGEPPAESPQAVGLLMTRELPSAEPLSGAHMPLAGTLELPAEGGLLPFASGASGLMLDLAALDLPPGADEIPVDTGAQALASELPLVLEYDAEREAATPAPEVEAVDIPGSIAAPLLPLTLDLATTPEPAEADGDGIKVIGPLRIGIPLFNIFLNEADELSRRLGVELAEWTLETEQPVADSTIALAHSLAGNSATVGYTDLSGLGRALENALMRSQAVGRGREGEGELFLDAADEIRRLLHQFAAGFLRPVAAELMERLADHERWPVIAALPPAEAAEAAEGAAATWAADAPPLASEPVSELDPEPDPAAELVLVEDVERAEQAFDTEDHVDPDLFPIFEEEADELLPQLQSRLREWLDRPSDMDAPSSCMRTLHTFKGGARLAGAMRLGDMAHRLESDIERLVASDHVRAPELEPLLAMADSMSMAFAQMRAPDLAAAVPLRAQEPPASAGLLDSAPESPSESAPQIAPGTELLAPAHVETAVLPAFETQGETIEEPPVDILGEREVDANADAHAKANVEPDAESRRTAPVPAPPPVARSPGSSIDWARFSQPVSGEPAPPAPAERSPAGTGAVRVRAGLLDRLVNQAGEVSITRARIDADVRSLQASLHELTESLDRMRRQLRDIELQAETQISSRLEQAKAASQAFDPLEMDRFTRFQELTRFMAESVNDVATLQRSLQRTLQSTEDELAAQARLTRELQDDLLRTRMVEFESMADRLYRTVRQAAKETGKQVRLEIVGGAIEVDRGVLERMTGPFEHLLRNSVAHGVEMAEQRHAAGKPPEGQIGIQVTQAGNEVAIEFRDDGAGLDLPRIRARAIERGLLAADVQVSDDELAQLIFTPGFSTATAVTELAGRGIGMDVVRSEVHSMGGRVEIVSQPGQGTCFRLLLPLTTAVTQVVMLRCGVMSVAVPSNLVEVVRRVGHADIDAAYASGSFEFADEPVPYFWLPALLQAAAPGEARSRSQSVVIIRSASQRVALHVDEVVGNQEVVVKNVGPQLSRLPGLAGVTLLPSGVVSLIYNPVALAAVYADEARSLMRQLPLQGEGAPPAGGTAASAAQRVPMVMVVDDSLTVRRVTQRLLVREGYRVVLAKDGLEALEKLAEERPAVLLSDIEMPRMDGFDLLRNVRADARLAGLPVVMITSRIAQKHRDYATELGVDHYLGKPYSEELLLSLVARYTGAEQAVRP
jgi:chemosensory pili system protein ChpA (sensor histidine kinase/response regulator)